MKTMVHEVGARPKEFDTLCGALGYCSDKKFTGYIVCPDGSSIINVNKGKRKTPDGKWVSTRIGAQ